MSCLSERRCLVGPPRASLSSGQIAPGAGQCPHPQAPPQHPAAEPGPGRVVAAAVPSAPTEANTESFRRTSVCPLGQLTPPSASPIARRASKELWQSRQRYSYRAINTDPTGRVAVGAGRWRRRSPRRSRTSQVSFRLAAPQLLIPSVAPFHRCPSGFSQVDKRKSYFPGRAGCWHEAGYTGWPPWPRPAAMPDCCSDSRDRW